MFALVTRFGEQEVISRHRTIHRLVAAELKLDQDVKASHGQLSYVQVVPMAYHGKVLEHITGEHRKAYDDLKRECSNRG